MPTFKLAAILALALTSQAHAVATPAPTLLPTLPVLASRSSTAMVAGVSSTATVVGVSSTATVVGVSSTASLDAPSAAQDLSRKAQASTRSPWVRSQAQLNRVTRLEHEGRLSSVNASALRQQLLGIRTRYGLRRGRTNPKLDSDLRNQMDQELELAETQAQDLEAPKP